MQDRQAGCCGSTAGAIRASSLVFLALVESMDILDHILQNALKVGCSCPRAISSPLVYSFLLPEAGMRKSALNLIPLTQR